MNLVDRRSINDSSPSDKSLLAQIPAPRFVLRPNRMTGMTGHWGLPAASAACAADAAGSPPSGSVIPDIACA